MHYLEHYLLDGANYQAKAVLAYIQPFCNIEESWNEQFHVYNAKHEVGRWENGREQGYVITLISNSKQLNIAFFEHRNSDSVCAVRWEQNITLNPPTIDTAEFGKKYKNKYDIDFEVSYGEVVKMSEWIINEFKEWWIKQDQNKP